MIAAKTASNSSPLGQVLVEFFIMTFVMVIAFFGIAALFRTQWDRIDCAHFAFEKTRAFLNYADEEKPHSLTSSSGRKRIHFQNRYDSVMGTAQCGSVTEKMIFKKLEYVPWIL